MKVQYKQANIQFEFLMWEIEPQEPETFPSEELKPATRSRVGGLL